MMSHVTSRKAGLFASSALLSVLLLAAPVFAQSTAPQAQTPAQAPKSDKVAPGSPVLNATPVAKRENSKPERVEARISDLHAKLTITAAQEPQWKKVADTMRGNAQAIEGASATREKALQTMTVMDDLKSYEGMAATHADGLHKLVAAFGPLYDSLSPEQKKAADTEFQGYRQRGPARK